MRTVDRVFEFIVRYKKIHDGNSPTIREIGDMCGISSTSVVSFHLDMLVKDGLIRRDDLLTRSIEVVGGKWKDSPHG